MLGKATDDAIKVLMQQLEDPMLALLILRILHAGRNARQKTRASKTPATKKNEEGDMCIYILEMALSDRSLDSFGSLALEIRDKFFDSIAKTFQTSASISKSCCDHLFQWIKGECVRMCLP